MQALCMSTIRTLRINVMDLINASEQHALADYSLTPFESA
jgi:hypothetical protein